MSTVLGIDLGTQSLKALVYDPAQKRVMASEAAALNLRQQDDGTAEQEASWWTDALQEAINKIDPDLRASVRAIGVSGQQHGFVPINRAGDVIAPVKLWCDTSTERECDEIMDRIGGRQACIDKAGNPIPPGFTASKIAWLKRRHPALYDTMETILLPHDYLNFVLTGERCMEAGDASGTGLLDIRERNWSAAMIAALDPDRDLTSCLPYLHREPGIIGTLQAEPAEQLGLPAGIAVSTGGGDNMMGAIGTGNVSVGSVTISLGTSGTVYAYADHPVIDPLGDIAAFCSSNGGWLPLMCTMNCTVTTELLRDLLQADLEAFETLVSRAPMGSGGLKVLPFFNGERTPNLPRAKGALLGMDTRNVTRENLLRAGMEGATYALRYGIDRLRGLGIQTSEIMLTGGGVGSASWRQLVADVCGSPVTVFHQDEGASYGAALQALSVLENSDLTELVQTHLTRNEELCCDPNSTAVEFYRDGYDTYETAVNAVSSLYT